MPGLSHYRNSRAGMRNDEPVYLNLFEVSIVPPAGLGSTELLIEGIKKVDGLEVDKLPGLVEQKFKFASRRYASSKPESTVVDLNIEFEVNINEANSMVNYKTLRQWSNLVYDPLTGRMGIKREYAGGPMVVSVHTKDGSIVRQYTFPVVWPSTPLPAMPLDYDSEEIWTVNMTFAADFWNDAIV